MTDDVPSPATPPEDAPAHRAPVRDVRPRSSLAIWALAASVILGIGATLAAFLWIALLPAVLLAVIALLKIRPQTMRGQGMAIVALVLALLVGSCHYMGAKAMRDIADHLGDGALAALASDDPDKINEWIAPKAKEAGADEQIKLRYAAVVDALGPFQGEVVVGSLWLGAGAFVVAPTDVEEFGQGIGEPWTLRPGSFWVKARFRDAMVHVELLIGSDDAEGLKKAFEDVQSQGPSRVLQDVRFFKDR